MTVTQTQQQNTTSPDTDPANIFSGGALGFFDRASKSVAGLYSDENLSRMEEKLNADMPSMGTFIREIFNMVSGFLGENMKDFAQTINAAGEDPEAAANESDQISSAVYGTADPKSEGARYAVNMLQRDENSLAAQASIGSGAGGAIKECNGIRIGPDGKPEGCDDEAVEDFRDGMEAAAETRERMWAEQKHSFGEIEMTGEEWSDLATRMRTNNELRLSIMERLIREGATREEAEKKYNKAMRISEIMAKPDWERTEEERRLLKDAKNDPSVANVIDWSTRTHVNGVTPDASELSLKSTRSGSIGNRADVFASAPDLTTEHSKAVAATKPLERTGQELAAATPGQQMASIPNMAGLDA